MKLGSVNANKGSQTTVNSLDPLEQQYRQQVFDASQAAANGGPGAGVNGAMDYYKQLMQGGTTGTSALAGDTNAVAGLMNPYQQQVIDAMNKQFNLQNTQTGNAADANATAARAFGGTRAAVMKGSAISQNQLGQGTQIGSLLQSGFTDAMNRAAMLAQGGYGGAQGAAGLGMQGVDNPDLWRMLMLKGGLMGTPYGTSTGQSYSGVSGSFAPSIG